MRSATSMMPFVRSIPREAWFWILGLVGLAISAPVLNGYVTLCIPTLLGFDGCMGCGLGRSVGYLARGQFEQSWASHPLGVPAVLVISYRIFHLVRHGRSQS